MEFVSTACSKLILAGEHLVVHGYNALSIPLFDHPTKITLNTNPNQKPNILFNQKLLSKTEFQVFQDDLVFFTNLIGLNPKQFDQLTNSSFTVGLPFIGVGLGASASFAIAMIKLLAEFSEIKLDQSSLLDFSMQAEIRYHGNPSGIDHTTIICEQPILFYGKTKQFELLNFDLPQFVKKAQIINTGKPKESTKQMVEYVTKKFKNIDPSLLSSVNDNLPVLIQALKSSNLLQFKQIINIYGEFLESIPICTPVIKLENELFRQKGGAAKICGAGGLTNASGVVLKIP